MEQLGSTVIGNTGSNHVSIRALSRCHPTAVDYWDGNWVESEIQVVVGQFRGRFRASLRSEEFQQFRAQVKALENNLKGTAEFSTMEGQIMLGLRGDGLGHVSVEGTALDEAGVGNKLSFTFEIDQTYLAEIVRSLDDVLQRFPVIGRPDA